MVVSGHLVFLLEASDFALRTKEAGGCSTDECGRDHLPDSGIT